MKRFSSLSRLLTGTLLICLGCLAFIGCNDVTSVTGLVSSQLTGAIARPVAAPVGINDTITWTNPAADPTPGSAQAAAISDGLVLSSPSMSFKALSTVAGQAPAIVLDVVNNATGAVVGTSAPIALVQQGSGLVTGQIILPQLNPTQSYIVRLATGTILNTEALAMTRALNQVPASLEIGQLLVAFSPAPLSAVLNSLPESFELNLTRTADKKYKLNDSTMNVNWTPGRTMPTDMKGGMVVRLYNGVTYLETHRQTKPINANATGHTAVFTGLSTTPFSRCDVMMDLRNAKPTPTDLQFP